MKSDEKLWEVCLDILQELYAAATPPLDFRKEMEAGNLKRPDWFMEHVLDEKSQSVIVDKHLAANKCNAHDRRKVDMAMLDYAPKFAKPRENSETKECQ
jgi:hypothetical protein